MGSLLVESIEVQDVPTVQGLVMIAATTVILVNLAADILYMIIDPRIRLGSRAS
jgi:peptide/nickel transport system permease protein